MEYNNFPYSDIISYFCRIKNENSGMFRIVFVAALMSGLFTTGVYAQKGAIEVGLGGGVSINSNPGSNMMYKGNRMTLNYSSGLNVIYNFHRSVALGFDVRMMELSRISDQAYPTHLKTTVGGDDKRFVYSKSLISACALVNGRYTTPRGYVYGGGALGYGLSRHDSKNLNAKTETYRAPDGGQGIVWGLQAGYTHGVNSVLGLYAEAALRNYTLSYDAIAPEVRPYVLLNYNITAYTLTVGVKARIMPKYRAQNDIPPMRGKGRSRRYK